ncbi:hypothetical protein BD309DRAFT_1052151, partial [Dichomitus squalens]
DIQLVNNKTTAYTTYCSHTAITARFSSVKAVRVRVCRADRSHSTPSQPPVSTNVASAGLLLHLHLPMVR